MVIFCLCVQFLLHVLIREMEALLMKQNSLPAFGVKHIKFKEMFSNPDGIPSLGYFSEINKTPCLETNKQILIPLPWTRTGRSPGQKVMAFGGNVAPKSQQNLQTLRRTPSFCLNDLNSHLAYPNLTFYMKHKDMCVAGIDCPHDGSQQCGHPTHATPPMRR